MFEILHKLPKCGTDTKWTNAVGKMMLIDLFHVGLPQTFSFLKMQFMQSPIKQSAIKWGLPANSLSMPIKKQRLTDKGQSYILSVTNILNIKIQNVIVQSALEKIR